METKFRGAVIIPFPNKTARWAYGSLVRLRGETYIVPDDTEVDETGEILDGLVEVHPESVGMGLGKSDKKGKDIYVGDYYVDLGGVWEITWNQEKCGVVQELFDTNSRGSEDGTVIGNTTDNPELSKGETQ